ncbi:PREDICTED: UPF0554 protein C2orf43 homolog [Ceratosolen solmsi marchali]|uniref:Lipid droplet-associated hydrolase n=1 Tax=Ceratosolen solmsi marchali TaxID=326594 RepID=A0AAJ6YQ22_9HYME|nr:PREDICTED: UPF0554 protein C2orf43 homolog [Ceratosolen solmsi marchali]
MYRKTVKVNEVPTEIISCTPWTENKVLQDGKQDIILIITGNPGVPAYYEEFAISLKNCLFKKLPVYIIGHSGHTKPPPNMCNYYPDIRTETHLYDLKGNLEHKAEFIKKYLPPNTKIHLIGHSIGSWFVLNLLKDNDIATRVVKCYLLFPTIERMVESPNGWFLTNVILRITPIIIFLSWIFTMLPNFLQEYLVKVFGLFYGYSTPSIVDAVLQTIHPMSLKRIFLLAKQEMIFVKELNNSLILQHKNKLFLYYGSKDGWTPVRYYEDLMMNHPTLNAQLCNKGYLHSFVLKNSVDIGEMIGNLISESIS